MHYFISIPPPRPQRKKKKEITVELASAVDYMNTKILSTLTSGVWTPSMDPEDSATQSYLMPSETLLEQPATAPAAV